MFDRNYSALLVQIETEEDLDRLEQQVSMGNLSLPTTGCLHGWNFDYTQYATTIVTEVGHDLSFLYTKECLTTPIFYVKQFRTISIINSYLKTPVFSL
jgi:hypothetical protein